MARVVTAILIATIVTLVIAATVTLCWYNFTGWTEFSWTTGSVPTWPSTDITRLRFKDAQFQVLRGDGVGASLNVTSVLNGMALGLVGGRNLPSALKLTAPLNAFSFVIPGFNDSASVSDPTASPWCAQPRGPCAGGCPFSRCSSDNLCQFCPGAPGVILTGKYRTL